MIIIYKQLALYLLAILTINFIPGPDMLYIIGQSLNTGKRLGMVAVLGTMAGCFVHIFAISIGLSALLCKSTLAFSIIKYSGACYLIYLGTTSLMKNNSLDFIKCGETSKQKTWQKVFLQGFFVDVLNPKVALFLLAFLPQFVMPSLNYPIWIQMLVLGLIFNTSSTLVNTLIVFFFSRMQQWFSIHPAAMKAQQKVIGCVLVSLGLRVLAFKQVL